ncbi:MAG: hypothetical protein WDA15_00730 [Trueperaceae bacterium]|jgi:hypothetical protein
MALTHLFLIGQLMLHLPVMPAGTEVRLMSVDLFTVHASAQVERAYLKFRELPPPGTEVRILIFPPDADDTALAEALSGATALKGFVSEAGTDILVLFEGESEPLSLRALLLQEREIWLDLPLGRSQ